MLARGKLGDNHKNFVYVSEDIPCSSQQLAILYIEIYVAPPSHAGTSHGLRPSTCAIRLRRRGCPPYAGGFFADKTANELNL